MLTVNTKDVSRLDTDDPAILALRLSRALVPAPQFGNRPAAVLLAPGSSWEAFAAAAPLVRFTNGPILVANGADTPAELARLNPAGIPALGNARVIAVGTSPPPNLPARRVDGANPPELAAAVDALRQGIAGTAPRNVLLVPDDPRFALPAAYWAAASGDALLFLGANDAIPAPTRDALTRYQGQARLYVLGGTLASDLAQFGSVTQIGGAGPSGAEIALAQFRDEGADVGWGLNGSRWAADHNVILANPDDPVLAAVGIPFGRLGTFGPLLWAGRDRLPAATEQFLWKIKPQYFVTPAEGPYNQVWILGDRDRVSYQVQGEADLIQEIEAYRFEGAGLSGFEVIWVVWIVWDVAVALWLALYSWLRLPEIGPVMTVGWALLGLTLGPFALWLYKKVYDGQRWTRHGMMARFERRGFLRTLAASAMNRSFDGPLMLVLSWLFLFWGLPLIVLHGPLFWVGNPMFLQYRDRLRPRAAPALAGDARRHVRSPRASRLPRRGPPGVSAGLLLDDGDDRGDDGVYVVDPDGGADDGADGARRRHYVVGNDPLRDPRRSARRAASRSLARAPRPRAREHVMKLLLPIGCSLALFLGVLTLLVAPLLTSLATAQAPSTPPLPDDQLLTGNTYRVAGRDPAETAAAIAQMIYPATREANQPGAVILTRSGDEASLFAAVPMIHHPIDAPILFVDSNGLPPPTAAALRRFKPHGDAYDRKVTAYVVGAVGDGVVRDVEQLGYSVRRIRGATDSPADLARAVDDYRAEIHAVHAPTVVVASLDGLDYTLPALSFIAHMSTGLVFVSRDGIPAATRATLQERFLGAYMYLMGPPSVISDQVAAELGRYGHVVRLGAPDPYSESVLFAGFRDTGQWFGYWIGRSPRDFGWGIAEPGHNFTFVNPADWQEAAPAAIFSHRGKHGPILLVQPDRVPEPVARYLTQTVTPARNAVYDQLFNHGTIVGGTTQISGTVQGELDTELAPAGP